MKAQARVRANQIAADWSGHATIRSTSDVSPHHCPKNNNQAATARTLQGGNPLSLQMRKEFENS
jgi:hypothetical protein